MQENADIGRKTTNKLWSAMKRMGIFIKHFFGVHNSSCRIAGKWRLEDHKRLRGPMCNKTKLPLILPKNRKGRV